MASKPPGLSIGEVARRVGVRTSALRYYERAGLLPAPARSGGQRRYGPAALERLHLIRFAQAAGFRLGEIRQLLGAGRRATPMGEGWRRIVPAKLAEIEAQMARLEEAKGRLQVLLTCACRLPEDCGRHLSRGAQDLCKKVPASELLARS